MDFCGVVNFLVIVLGQGPIVALLVQLLKRIPVVRDNPLRAAAILNAIAALATGFVWCGLNVSAILAQIVAGFGTSVAAYEVVKHTLAATEDSRYDRLE